jgi:signal transduction histidine kinase
VNLGDLLFRVLSGIESKLPYYIKLETDLPEDMIIHCHPKQIRLVFTHILRNAINALESKPSRSQRELIRIAASVEKMESVTRYSVSISNTGPTIPEQDLKRIFDPFFSSREPGKAAGLGMWLSYMIIKDHGGKIEASSTGEEVTFRVCIPGGSLSR